MNLKQLEQEALHLPEEGRTALEQKMLLSLDEPSEAENAVAWLAEARRRAEELDKGLMQPMPADQVPKKAQALLR